MEAHNIVDKEKLTEKLADFGLTVNQAKVYLSVVQSRITNVPRIAQNTQLHRQDIYKMMPKLEKMGLITRLIGKPAKFEALPIEMALESLVLNVRKEAEERIARLKDSLETLKKEVKNAQKTVPRQKDPQFVLLTTDAEIKNKMDLVFEGASREFCIVTTPRLAPRIIHFISERIKMLAKKGAKTRIIIENSANDDAASNLFGKLKPINGNVVAKQLFRDSLMPYRIIDGKEIWITLTKETESGRPCFLWTNAPNIVKFYRQNFERAWKDKSSKNLIG